MKRLFQLLAFCVLTVSAFAQTKKILVQSNDPALLKQLQGASAKATIVPVTDDNVMREIGDADAFIGNIKPEQVRAGKKLQWVQITSAGAERVLHLSGGNDLRDSKIILTNNQIVQGPEIADHAMGMLLMLTRHLHTFYGHTQQELWQPPRPFPGIELNGRTAVILGVGGIGTQIAFRAWAHGMNVIGVDPEDIPYMPVISKVIKPDRLDEVLPEADVVFIAAPHTTMSHKMMGPRQFELMKKGSYFIAVSRGGLYDINCLVTALASKQLAGAGVDVTDPEPLPKGHPLWKFSNVIVTPHIAGRSDKDNARMVGTVQENIRRFVDGKPLINVVDKQKGY
ncbi:MAG: D-2-hydroxyacid dehydrogenase [Acidobacteria bacterium]|nr:D-2-hydroxyacid dehydrogenase [Acidobacteriota bacterium]MCI0717832.1 D-2-hydroxyacid dehydrogenase [Acidobacteriota bacterium]